ncbi:hypothetical protein GCM10010211_81600 [Streptomyces albospinus]|uniref:Transposase putative helix-turn-helix domain-containing protein n=1 Tax=Streptomyces albospinus TaxID=285515 RepID=A0ABQ2VNG6_9ACTN|nr:hypothetical protein GCM10010211_81600 [Streptomyces albospinus]
MTPTVVASLYVEVMTMRAQSSGDAGCVRYTFRLRVSVGSERLLAAEWARCRWIWNEAVAKSKAVHAYNQAHPGDKPTCGPAQ